MPRRARITRRSPAANPQSGLALRATSARVQRGRINPGPGVGRAPHQQVADLVRHRAAEQRAEVAAGPARQALHAIDVDGGEHAGAGDRIDQRRAERLVIEPGALLAERTSRTMSSPGPSGTVQRPPLEVEHGSQVTSTSAGRSACAATSSAVRTAAFGTSALSYTRTVSVFQASSAAPARPSRATSATAIAIHPQIPRIGPSPPGRLGPPGERHCPARPRVPPCTSRDSR